MNRLNAATPAFYINTQRFSANNISTNLFCVNPESFLRASLSFSSIYLFSGVSCSLVACSRSSLRFRLFGSLQCSLFTIIRHTFEISDDSRMRITTKTIHRPLYNGGWLCTSLSVCIYPGVNSRAELVTLALGLRPERRFAAVGSGIMWPNCVPFILIQLFRTLTFNQLPVFFIINVKSWGIAFVASV